MTYKDETPNESGDIVASSGRFRVIACNGLGEPIVNAIESEFTDLHAAIRAAISAIDPVTMVCVYDDEDSLQAIASSLA